MGGRERAVEKRDGKHKPSQMTWKRMIYGLKKNVAKEENSNHLVRLPYLLAHKK